MSAERDSSGRFLPGASGNPIGRSHGTVAAQTELRRAVEAAAPEIIAKQIALAKKGNPRVAAWLLERILPAARSAPIGAEIQLEGSAPEQAERVVGMLSSGQLTLEEGAALLNALAATQAIRDGAVLADRVTEIEARLTAFAGATPSAHLGAPRAALPAPKDDGDAK